MSRQQSTIGGAQHYGPRGTNEGIPTSASTYGVVKQIVVPVKYDDVNSGLPAASANVDEAVRSLKANSYIKGAYFNVTTAFTSAGSAVLNIGVEQADGTAVDADGIDAIAVGALTANAWITCDGALVGASVGANAAQVSFDDATAAFTAGEGVLILEVIEQIAPNA